MLLRSSRPTVPSEPAFSKPAKDSKHLSDFLTERYAAGRITSEHQLERIEDHIRVCDECRKRVERVDAVQEFKEALKRLWIS